MPSGIVNITSGTTLGDTAIVMCDEGFDVNGNSSIVCGDSGWLEVPTCNIQGQ